jgi:hypothetical protein
MRPDRVEQSAAYLGFAEHFGTVDDHERSFPRGVTGLVVAATELYGLYV